MKYPVRKAPVTLPALLCGDVREWLSLMPRKSIHCCVTSPPYWGLRDYGIEGQFGLEDTPEGYVEQMVKTFREVRRVLRDDGTVWLNLGDSYSYSRGNRGTVPVQRGAAASKRDSEKYEFVSASAKMGGHPIIKKKELCGIPWRVALALQEDGWYLRQDIIWAKPNPMPESVKDRCTRSHEYLFMLTKEERYYYDSHAIQEPSVDNPDQKRNRRDVWTVTTKPYKGAHFATFPPDLIEPCILAGTSERGCCSECGMPWKRIIKKREPVVNPVETGNQIVRHDGGVREKASKGSGGGNVLATTTQATDEWEPQCNCQSEVSPCIVLDPFAGSGTTGLVAKNNNRDYVLIELNPEYCELARKRLNDR